MLNQDGCNNWSCICMRLTSYAKRLPNNSAKEGFCCNPASTEHWSGFPQNSRAAMVAECRVCSQDSILTMWPTQRSPRFWTLNHCQKIMSHLLMVQNEPAWKTRLPLLLHTLACACVGAVLPFPHPLVLFKSDREDNSSTKLFSQAKCQVRTGKVETHLQVLEGATSDRRICADGRDAPGLMEGLH